MRASACPVLPAACSPAARGPLAPLPLEQPPSPTAAARRSPIALRSPVAAGWRRNGRPRAHAIGERVLFDAQGYWEPGVVRFSGPTQFGEGEWVGVELDRSAGKNDGSIHGVPYFSCQPRHGVFCRSDRLRRPRLTTSVSPGPSSRRPELQRLWSESSADGCDGGRPRLIRRLSSEASSDSQEHVPASASSAGGAQPQRPRRIVRRSAPPPRRTCCHGPAATCACGNGSGTSLTSAPSRALLDRLYASADADGDGLLSLAEFGRLLAALDEPPTSERAIAKTFSGLCKAYEETIASCYSGSRETPRPRKGLDFALFRQCMLGEQGLQVTEGRVLQAIARMERESTATPVHVASPTAADGAACRLLPPQLPRLVQLCGGVQTPNPTHPIEDRLCSNRTSRSAGSSRSRSAKSDKSAGSNASCKSAANSKKVNSGLDNWQADDCSRVSSADSRSSNGTVSDCSTVVMTAGIPEAAPDAGPLLGSERGRLSGGVANVADVVDFARESPHEGTESQRTPSPRFSIATATPRTPTPSPNPSRRIPNPLNCLERASLTPPLAEIDDDRQIQSPRTTTPTLKAVLSQASGFSSGDEVDRITPRKQTSSRIASSSSVVNCGCLEPLSHRTAPCQLDDDSGCETDEDMPQLEAFSPKMVDESEMEVSASVSGCADPPQSFAQHGGDFSKCWGRSDLLGALKGY